MPSSSASATTVTSTWRTAYRPTTNASRPSTALITRTPPVRSLPANAPTNWKMPATTSWMPNSTAIAMTVGPGQATAATPASSVRTPKDSSQIQCRPSEAIESVMSVRGSGLIRGSSGSQDGHGIQHRRRRGGCRCAAGQWARSQPGRTPVLRQPSVSLPTVVHLYVSTLPGDLCGERRADTRGFASRLDGALPGRADGVRRCPGRLSPDRPRGRAGTGRAARRPAWRPGQPARGPPRRWPSTVRRWTWSPAGPGSAPRR